MRPVRFQVYSDYLCPWCYNASVRIRTLEGELGRAVHFEWRSYLLRPRPGPGRDLERFRAYTESWQRPAREPDAGHFRVWQGTAGPPSHSLPAQLVAKAAAEHSEEAFRAVHDRLLRAYFAESRDISELATLRELWLELELPPEAFERIHEAELAERVAAEHREAVESGVTGVPALRLAGEEPLIVGAQPLELYRRWYRRTRARLDAEDAA